MYKCTFAPCRSLPLQVNGFSPNSAGKGHTNSKDYYAPILSNQCVEFEEITWRLVPSPYHVSSCIQYRQFGIHVANLVPFLPTNQLACNDPETKFATQRHIQL